MSTSLSRLPLHAEAASAATVWRGPGYETVGLGSPWGANIGLPTGYAHSAASLLSQGFHAVGEKGILGGGVREDKDV